jgi:predicted dehydrogenase
MKIRCGLVGCGNIVQQIHLPAWHAIADLSIEAVCDSNEVALGRVCKQLGISRGYTEIDRFLDENPRLDFVCIATPGFTHYGITTKVVDRGLNTIIEKPIALSLQETLDLKARAERAKVLVCVVQNYRFRDSVLAVRRAFDEGLLGRICQVDTTLHGQSIYNEEAPWSWDERRHRVLLYEHAVHLLDLQVYFAGGIEKVLAIKVYVDEELNCTKNIYAMVEHKTGAVGNIDLQLFSSSNYAQSEIFGTANDATIKFSPESYRLYSGQVNPLDELYGDFRRIMNFVVPALIGKVKPPKIPRQAQSHHRLFSSFVQALQDRSLPLPVSIDDVLPTMELLEALAVPTYGSPLTFESLKAQRA